MLSVGHARVAAQQQLALSIRPVPHQERSGVSLPGKSTTQTNNFCASSRTYVVCHAVATTQSAPAVLEEQAVPVASTNWDTVERLRALHDIPLDSLTEATSSATTPPVARPGFHVVAAAIFPATNPPAQLHDAVSLLFGALLPTVTSAKKACKRGQIHVNGMVQNKINRHGQQALMPALAGEALQQDDEMVAKSYDDTHANKMPMRMRRIVRPSDKLELVQPSCNDRPVCMQSHEVETSDSAQIVYEDDHLACIIKPQGVYLQGEEAGGVFLPLALAASQQPGALRHPRYVHCAEKDVGGVRLVAKTRPAFCALSAAVQAQEVQKQYLALVGGRLQGRGRIERTLDGKLCATEWCALGSVQSRRHGWVSTVRMRPLTAHRHQLRRHMALMQHPIIGDQRYTYAYRKQYAQHHPEVVCHDEPDWWRAPDVDDDSNSAFVALRRLGRPGPRTPPKSDSLSGIIARDRLAYEARHSEPRPHHPQQSHFLCKSATNLRWHTHAGSGGTWVERAPLSQWPLCMWVSALSLTHPCTGKLLTFEAPEPPLFEEVRRAVLHAWQEHAGQPGARRTSPYAGSRESSW